MHPPETMTSDILVLVSAVDLRVSALVVTLLRYFFFTVALDLVFLIIPIVISANEIRQERRKQERAGKDFEYSLLQWEAKKFKYEWNSWGGDKINDNLDLTMLGSMGIFRNHGAETTSRPLRFSPRGSPMPWLFASGSSRRSWPLFVCCLC